MFHKCVESARVTALPVMVVLSCNCLFGIHPARAAAAYSVHIDYQFSDNTPGSVYFRAGLTNGRMLLTDAGLLNKNGTFASTSIPQAGGHGCVRKMSGQLCYDVTRLSGDSWRIRKQEKSTSSVGTVWEDTTFEFQGGGGTCGASLLSSSYRNNHGSYATLRSIDGNKCELE